MEVLVNLGPAAHLQTMYEIKPHVVGEHRTDRVEVTRVEVVDVGDEPLTFGCAIRNSHLSGRSIAPVFDSAAVAFSNASCTTSSPSMTEPVMRAQ